MRLLHTSDWHLGSTLEGVSRERDHARFLEWLAAAIDEHQVDVLLVCGDVFDQAQPSAEAQRLYYGFLHRIAGGRLKKVVVVGGNHDSASRLDAPRELLDALSVHVVGGIPSDPAGWDRCLCPIGPAEGPEAVVLAVPFVHEFRLGVRLSGADSGEIATAMRERFAELYRQLADRAEKLAQGAPLIATGHLACAGSDRDDAPAEIHLIGSIGGIPPEVFAPRLGYVALGHIHRCYRVGESAAWYSGSPVALSAREAARTRRILLVDLERGAPATVTPVEVPALRQIEVLQGTVDSIADRLRALCWQSEAPPLVYAEIQADHLPAGSEVELHKAAEENHKGVPQIVGIRLALERSASAAPDAAATPRLRELNPEQVFKLLCERRGEQADEVLLTAFRSLLQAEDETEGGAR